MLDEGRNQDWFNSPEICILAVVAIIGFLAFMIWELTEKNPIVDLRIFRHRGFTAAATTYAVGFGAFFASIVLLPLWLQSNMGYTATWAGYATGIMGIFAVLSAPLVGRAVEKVDARLIVSLGILGLGLISVWRMGFTPDVTFGQMALPTLLTGPFMVMFFVPVTGLAMASCGHDEQANAAGISNFMRTLAGAFATSLVQTGWSNAARHNQTELAGVMQRSGQVTIDAMTANGVSHETATTLLSNLVEGQSVMLATLNMFATIAICFLFAATLIWMSPKPKGPIDTSGAH
jgi:DHA2 family multidrug resistance protein